MEGQRPTGLLVLAILNFVFAGMGAIGLPILIIMALLKDRIDNPEIQEAMAQMPEGGALYLTLALGLAEVTLLTISGIGYLKQKRFMGRHMANLYSLVAMSNVGISIFTGPQGLKFLSLFGIIYPVLTLIFVNTVFRDDLVN